MRGSLESAKSIFSAELPAPSLKAYREAHKRADTFCREVQAFVDEAGIPAVNELRYAGYHLLAALSDEGGVIDPSNLTKATNHANRACYEAGEAGILVALDKIAEFKNDYRDISITSVIPNYTDILRAAQESRDRVVKERDHGDDKIADYDAFMNHFMALKEHCKTLELGREELNKVLNSGRRDGRRFITVVSLAILGVIVALMVGIPPILRLYEDAHPKTPSSFISARHR